jgi:hypothetical protein
MSIINTPLNQASAKDPLRSIKEGLSGTKFSLNLSPLLASSARSVFEKYFDTTFLELSNAKITDETSKELTLKGTYAEKLFGGMALSLTIQFKVESGGLEFKMTVSGFSDWKPSVLKGVEAGLADAFAFQEVVFEVDSTLFSNQPEVQSIHFGKSVERDKQEHAVRFSTRLKLPTLSKEVVKLINPRNQPEQACSGYLLFRKDHTEFCWTIATGSSLPFSNSTIALSFTLASIVIADDEGEKINHTYFGFEGGLDATMGKMAFLATTTDLDINTLNFSTYLKEPMRLSLADAGRLLDPKQGDLEFPAEFPLPTSFYLQELGFEFALKGTGVFYAYSRIKIDKEWRIFSDLLHFYDLELILLCSYSPEPKFNFGVWGKTNVGKHVKLQSAINFPELSFQCGLQDEAINIKGLVEELSGTTIDLPALQCTDLDFVGNVKQSTYGCFIRLNLDRKISIGPMTAGLDAVELSINYAKDQKEIAGSATVSSEFELLGNKMSLAATTGFGLDFLNSAAHASIFVSGELSYCGMLFSVYSKIDKEKAVLKASLENLELKKVVENLLGISYPDGLPNPLLKELSLSVDTKGNLHIRTLVTDKVGLHFANSHLHLQELEFDLKRSANESEEEASSTKAFISIKGRLDVESAIVVEDYALTFNYAYDPSSKKASWKVNNAFNASIFGHKMAVKAEYKQDKDTALSFSVTDPFPAIELAGPAPAKFALKEVSLELIKGEKGNYTWDISAKSNFETPLFTYEEGKISFYHKDKKTGLKFSAGKQDIRFIQDEHTPYFTLEKAELEFLYDSSGKGSWACAGSSDIIAKQVPKQISKLLPSTKVKAGFIINSKVAEIKIEYDGLFPIPLPPKVEGVDTSAMDLGELYIGVKGLALDFRNGGKLSATVGVGLPKELNDIFKDANGKVIEVFRTYNPQTREGALDFDFSISKKDGLGLAMKSSPFKIIANPGKDGYVIDLGEFGKIAFELPKFSLKGNSLKASGGFKILPDPTDPDKPRLYLPTAPIKHFLQAVGLNELNKILINKIPLDGVNFAPIVNGQRTFDSAAFLKKFTNSEVKPEQKLPEWIQKAFDTIDGIAGKLPDAFLEYGDLKMVDQFRFEIEMDTNCSIKCKFSVKDDEGNGKPLKLLLPQFPQLIGIKLKSFSFGQLFSGTLFRFDIDAEFDQFDIPQLLAALVLDPEHPLVKEYLANPKTFHNQFTLEELMVIIIYQTQVPIPIPLFYDKIGFSSISLSGTEAKGSLSFPFPSIGLNELKNCAVLIGELVGFFKDGKSIDWPKIGEMDFLKFKVGPTYVKLPKYVATEKGSNEGKLIGTKEGFDDIGPLKILAAVMDAIQEKSINKLIRSISLERRVNNFDMLLFGLLELECKYAFTTPFEFVDKAYDMLEIPEKTREEYIGLLPPRRVEVKQEQGGQDRSEPITPETEGLVVFLNNKMGIGTSIAFENGFGLMATGQGFGLGALLKGRVGDDVFNVYLRGLFRVEKQGDILLAGEGHLKLLKTNILAGSFRFNNDGLLLEAKVGDEKLPVQIEGRLEGTFRKDYFQLKGNGNLRILGLEIKANCESELLFSKEEEKIYLHGEYQLGSVSRLQSTLNYQKKGESTVMAVHFSGEVAKLLAVTLNGNLLANNGFIEAAGDAKLKIFDEEVLSTQFLYNGRTLTFKGTIDLFPQHKEWIKVKGEANGLISNNDFSLSAKAGVEVMKQHFVESQLTVNNQEARIISRLFGLRTALFIQKEPGLQIIGSISPILVGSFFSLKQKKNLGDTISQVTGGSELSLQERSETEHKLSLLKGPSVLIGTNPARFRLAGSSSLLGFESDAEIIFHDEPGKTGFEFECSGRIFNLIRTDLRVNGTLLTHNAALRLSGTIYFGELADEICAEIRKVAQSVQDAMEKAKRDLAMANEALKRVVDRIEEEVKKAIKEYDENLRKALVWLEEKKNDVNGLQGKIDQCKREIAGLKQQIEAKKAWYDNSEWWQKSYRWVELGAVVAKLGIQIMERYAAIALYEGLRLTANGLLAVAEEGVRNLRAIGDAGRWGLDESVKALKAAADAALKRATDALIIAQNTVGVFEEWSKTAIKASKETFEIHNASFEADTPLHRLTGGSVLIGVDVSFFGTRQTHIIKFNFADRSIGIGSLVDVLKKRKANPSEMAIKARKEGTPVLEAALAILQEYPDVNPSQMSVALLRGGYDRREEVQKIALKQLYVDTGRAKPQEIVWAIKAGMEFIESANQIQR